ncbi:MAG: alkaline phosphatase family protein [Acidobacteria bacterium]|nr:alkaline phosphatase family protein [Acidobacteriota bacterium]
MTTRARRAAWGLAVALAAAATLSSVVRVPPGSMVVCSGAADRLARRVAPGVHLRWPIVEECRATVGSTRHLAGTATFISPEGASLHAGYDLDLDPARAMPRALFDLLSAGDLDAAARGAIDVAVRSLPPTTIPAGGSPDVTAGASRRLEASLASIGVVPDSVVLRIEAADGGATPGDERPDVAAAIRAHVAPRHPVLVIGVDSADWARLEPLAESGDLPALRALRDRGAWGVLKSSIPTLSPLLWTTMATGKGPEQHGISDFVTADPATGTRIPISSRSRTAEALWSILTRFGIPSLTVGWWATWPAERVAGEMVTDHVAYSLMEPEGAIPTDGLVNPPSIEPQISRMIVRPEQVTLEDLRSIIDVTEPEFARVRGMLPGRASWQDPEAHLLRILAATRSYHRIALDRLHRGQSPLTLVYFEGLDEVNHRFAVYEPPAMRWADPAKAGAFAHAVDNFYRLQDRLIGELVAASSPDTVVVVVSDHGFASGDRRPLDVPPDIEGKPGRWHTLDGVILAAGPTVARGRLPRDPSILDIAPTILSLLSIPAARDMPGHPIAELIGTGALPPPPAAEVATYERTKGRRPADASSAGSEADGELLAKLTALGYIGSAERGHQDPAQGARGGVPGTATSHVNVANALFAAGRLKEASVEYEAALAVLPAFVPARLGLAQSLIATGKAEEGWRRLEDTLREADDLDARNYLSVARYCRSQGRAVEGATMFERLTRREGLEPARFTALGLLLAAAGRDADALSALRSALAIEPASTDAIVEASRLLAARGDDAGNVSILERARKARPDGVVVANLLAVAYEKAGRRGDALGILNHALESSPRHVATLANLAGLRARGGEFTEAVRLLERARQIDPSNPAVVASLIVALGDSRDLPAARRVMGDAGPIAERIETLNAFAYACYVNGATEDARRAVTMSLARSPGQPDARGLLERIDRSPGPAAPVSSPKEPGL